MTLLNLSIFGQESGVINSETLPLVQIDEYEEPNLKIEDKGAGPQIYRIDNEAKINLTDPSNTGYVSLIRGQVSGSQVGQASFINLFNSQRFFDYSRNDPDDDGNPPDEEVESLDIALLPSTYGVNSSYRGISGVYDAAHTKAVLANGIPYLIELI